MLVLRGLSRPIDSPVWSPDGMMLAQVDRSGDLTVWDTKGRLIGRLPGKFGPGSSAPAFLPAGKGIIGVAGHLNVATKPFNFVKWKPDTSQLESTADPEPDTKALGENRHGARWSKPGFCQW